jgi:hypothetical protein
MEEDIFIVKAAGLLRWDDAIRLRDRLSEELPGKVVVIDGSIENIWRLNPEDGRALVRMLEEEFREDGE